MTESRESHALAQPERLPVVADGLNYPTMVAASALTGNVFVANTDADNVILIPRALASGGSGQPQTQPKTLSDPTAIRPNGVAIAPNGDVVVVNMKSVSVSVFSGDGLFLRSITLPFSPQYVAISQFTGDAFITGAFDETSAVMRIPAARLRGEPRNIDLITDASFDYSDGIVVSPRGDVFVTNQETNSVTRISARRASGFMDGEITVIGDAGKFNNPEGIAVGRNGDILVTNTNPGGFVTRIPAARAYGNDNTIPLDLITSSTLTIDDDDTIRMCIVVSPFTGDAYVTNPSTNTVVVIPAARAAGGVGTPVVENTDPLSSPNGIAISPVTGDLFVANSGAGTVTRIIKGIKVVGADGEGQFYTVPPAVKTVTLHTQGGSLDGGTGLDLQTTPLAVTPGEQFYLINQYNAAYIFHRQKPGSIFYNPWNPLLVSGGAGTGTSVQIKGVPRSDGNGIIYPGNGGRTPGGGGWGGGAGSGVHGNVGYNGYGDAGSGNKGGDSHPSWTKGPGGLHGADGANVGETGARLGGQGEVSLAMHAAAVTFTLSGGNSYSTGYKRGGAGYSAGGNSAEEGSGAGSGYAANMLADKVTATSAPTTNGNIPTAVLIPG